jgi:hypothetical protein
MVFLAGVIEQRESVAIALIAFGSALMPLAVLLPRLVGQLRVSPRGLEAEVAAVVVAEAEAKGLSDAATEKAVQLAKVEVGSALSQWLADLLSEAEQEAPAGATVEIDVERFQEALRDPLVQDLLAQVRRYGGRVEDSP